MCIVGIIEGFSRKLSGVCGKKRWLVIKHNDVEGCKVMNDNLIIISMRNSCQVNRRAKRSGWVKEGQGILRNDSLDEVLWRLTRSSV